MYGTGVMKEKTIENKIKKYLKSIGAYFVKQHGNAFVKSGIPDVLACYHGTFIGIEVKNEKNTTTLLQDHHLLEIQKAGGVAFVARSVEDVKEKINEII